MASVVSINHSPEANRRAHPVGNPTACAEQRPRTAKCHLQPAGLAGFVSDSAGDRRDLSCGPEGAEMGLWASLLFALLSTRQHLSFQHHSSIVPATEGLAMGLGVLSSPEEQAWQV